MSQTGHTAGSSESQSDSTEMSPTEIKDVAEDVRSEGFEDLADWLVDGADRLAEGDTNA